jgi:hypothetical protein
MGRALAILLLIVGIVVLVLTARPVRDDEPRPLGARLRGERVRFAFRASRFVWTTYLANGDSIPMRELRVRRVSVVGPFNGWDAKAWPLDRDEGEWELSRRRADLGLADSAHFAFVVNGRFWVEPPLEASNRIVLESGRGALEIPAGTEASGRDRER